jgi:subfamily B ATP-binding cassette protein MsbA
MIADPISKLGTINTVIQNALASAERIFEVIDITPTIREKENAIEVQDINGRVEFKSVHFKYEKDGKEVLSDINLTVQPGEILALVGRSGAGKTSLVNLIPRFYDPSSGTISIDRHDLKDLKLEPIRKQMGIIPQETVLFSGSIRDNIAYAKIEATDEEIEKAARMANAHDFIIGLPVGYNSKVGERGVRLSGGERQRIAIARALLRNPKILIFDEATSSLDSESERQVQEAMQRLMTGRTVFIIAHRLSTVQHADKIIVIEEGKIAEQGKHGDLLSKGGIYKKLYEMQFKDEEAINNK